MSDRPQIRPGCGCVLELLPSSSGRGLRWVRVRTCTLSGCGCRGGSRAVVARALARRRRRIA